jgi:hypothetical protein
MTMVRELSIVVLTSLHRKSTDTRGSSQTARKPLAEPAAASRKAAFT